MHKQGFTLIEMMVAVALFSVVMMVSVGALLSLVDANRRAQASQSVMNNLNVALDGMVRALRMGQKYEVSASNTQLSFAPYGADPDALSERWTYSFRQTPGAPEGRGRIWKTYRPNGFSVAVDVPLTAVEVDIDSLQFYATGVGTGDNSQARMFMVVRGKAGYDKPNTITRFDIQASATQRLLDL